MTSNYNGSKRHKDNLRKAAEIGRVPAICQHCEKTFTKANLSYHKKTCLYSPENRKECKGCGEQLFVKENSFCGRSCAASYNMLRRSPEVREKQYKKLSKTMSERPRKGIKRGTTYENRKCKQCAEKFKIEKYKSKKFCSDKCRHIDASLRAHKWGRCLSIKYHCISTNEVVILQSTWEESVAEWMDKQGINWIRPDPIPWVDSNNKERLYFPDFYIEELDLYLDPKNDRVAKRDKEKIEEVSKKIKLVVGKVSYITESIAEMIKLNGM